VVSRYPNSNLKSNATIAEVLAVLHNFEVKIQAHRRCVVGATVLVLLLLGFALGHRPVLLHLFAETDCACGDYHEDVTGWILLNPLRDRSPEQTANSFLRGIQEGHCMADPAVCGYAMEHRASEWQLATRQDRGGRVSLYYQLTKYGVKESQHRLTGEGMITVQELSGTWRIVDYSAYF
jgi:hypothetical protein